VHMLELTERGVIPCGWILEIVGRIRCSVSCNLLSDVFGDAKSALVVGLVQLYVNPGEVLLVRVALGVEVVHQCRLAKADELVVDEAILDVVELVHVLHKRLGREHGTEVRQGGICNEQTLCVSVHISRRDSRDTLDENLGVVIEG
jgi:hypothetical protein